MDMVRDINDSSIIVSPHFQRKLVWRDAHKVDFIKTILLGYPFPEIFIARGDIDVDSMTSTSCIVDGQQRMNAILEFTQNRFKVDGKFFTEYSQDVRSDFLKYEIPVIDLELDRNDNQVVEIFKRLNRTFYSLSQVEKISTEFASSNYMLVAKLLCGELRKIEEEETFLESKNVDPLMPSRDPYISQEFVEWGNSKIISSYYNLILDAAIFTPYEISRQIHLMFTLNVMTTILFGIYTRNDEVNSHLERYAENFENRDDIVDKINSVSELILNLNLSDKRFWFTKSTAFSLITTLSKYDLSVLNKEVLELNMNAFSQNVSHEYALAAKEGVNNRKERILREENIDKLISESKLTT